MVKYNSIFNHNQWYDVRRLQTKDYKSSVYTCARFKLIYQALVLINSKRIPRDQYTVGPVIVYMYTGQVESTRTYNRLLFDIIKNVYIISNVHNTFYPVST